MSTARSYLETVRERVVIYDGATGTNLQLRELSAHDFGGESLEGCNEMLCLTRPDVVQELHRSFLEVGVDVVETNSFGSLPIVLAEYQIADRAEELARASARLAKEVASGYSTPDRPTLRRRQHGAGHEASHPRPDQLRRPTRRLRGARPRAARRRSRPAPRRDLLRPPPGQGRHPGVPPCDAPRRTRGADPGAGDHRADRPDAARHRDRRGPLHARRHEARRHRHELRDRPGRDVRIAAAPVRTGAHAHLGAAQRRPALGRRRQDALRPVSRRARRAPLGVRPRARCLGHRRLLRHDARAPRQGRRGLRRPRARPSVAGARAVGRLAVRCGALSSRSSPSSSSASARMPTARSDSATRCSPATGTRRSPWHATRRGGRPPARRLRRLHRCRRRAGHDRGGAAASRPSRPSRSSSTPPRPRSSRRRCSGSAGDPSSTRSTSRTETLRAPGSTASSAWHATTAPRSSAPASTPTGQARTAEWKLRAARAIHDLAVGRYGLEPADLLFDPLALPLSTGMEESRRDGIETIEAIRRIKSELPGVHTVLGLSNVSFGLSPAARQLLNSVFLHECVQAGLDAAIVHAGQDPAPAPHLGRGPRDLPRSHLRPAPRGLRPALGADRGLRGRERGVALGDRGPLRLDRRAPARAAHRGRRPQRPRDRARRGARRRASPPSTS